MRRKFKAGVTEALSTMGKIFPDLLSEKDGGVGRLQLINFSAALGVKLFCG